MITLLNKKKKKKKGDEHNNPKQEKILGETCARLTGYLLPKIDEKKE